MRYTEESKQLLRNSDYGKELMRTVNPPDFSQIIDFQAVSIIDLLTLIGLKHDDELPSHKVEFLKNRLINLLPKGEEDFTFLNSASIDKMLDDKILMFGMFDDIKILNEEQKGWLAHVAIKLGTWDGSELDDIFTAYCVRTNTTPEIITKYEKYSKLFELD